MNRLTVLVLLTVGCGGKPSSSGMCVYNHAYQETFAPDSLATIQAQASGCYVLVDPDEPGVPEAIAGLHAAGNTVGCYTSVGTCEDWRDDFDQLQPACVSEPWGEWAGEYFLDAPDDTVLAVMDVRFQRFADMGCDVVELDNMDWAYDATNREQYGISVEEDAAAAYVGTLCQQAEALGLGCMAKSTTRGLPTAMGGTFESYPDDLDWWDSGELQALLDDGLLGVVVHYAEWDCDGVFETYLDRYGDRLSFLCEDRETRGYRHYNR